MFPGDTARGTQVWMVIFWVVAATPVVIMRGMKDLSWIAIWGGAASVIVGFCAVIGATTEPPGPDEVIHRPIGPSSFTGVLAAMSSVAFSYGAAPEAPILVNEASKRDRKYIPVVSAAALAFVCAMYLMVAWTGFAIFGDSLAAVDGNILSRLSYGPATVLALALITSHVLSAYSVLMQPLLLVMERIAQLPDPYHSPTHEESGRTEKVKVIDRSETGENGNISTPGTTNTVVERASSFYRSRTQSGTVLTRRASRLTMPHNGSIHDNEENRHLENGIEMSSFHADRDHGGRSNIYKETTNVIAVKLTMKQKILSLIIRLVLCGLTLFLAE